MNLLPPWREASDPLFSTEAELEGFGRSFSVWPWEGRLAFQDRQTPDLWWVTQDEVGEDEAQLFWKRAVETRRVLRAYAVSYGFQGLKNGHGTRMALAPTPFDVLVAQDGSCRARVEGDTQWHPFESVEKKRLKRPCAFDASVLSPYFRVEASRKGLASLRETVFDAHIARLPGAERELWEHGETARPVRLIKTAMALGWTDDPAFGAALSLPQFWELALGCAAKRIQFQLPLALRECAELRSRARVVLSYYRRHRAPAGLQAEVGPIRLHVSFIPSQIDSQHERLEACLELHDWLSEFFPAQEVERWLK